MAVYGQGGVDDLLHAPADSSGIVEGYRAPDLQVHIVTVTHGDVDSHLARLEEVVGRFAEHEEKRAGVGP